MHAEQVSITAGLKEPRQHNVHRQNGSFEFQGLNVARRNPLTFAIGVICFFFFFDAHFDCPPLGKREVPVRAAAR